MKIHRVASALVATAALSGTGPAAAHGVDTKASFNDLMREVTEFQLDLLPQGVAPRGGDWRAGSPDGEEAAGLFGSQARRDERAVEGYFGRDDDVSRDDQRRGRIDQPWHQVAGWHDDWHDRGWTHGEEPCLPVPEPGAATLLLAGLLPLIALRHAARRRGPRG